jgi:hypothetical protein
MRLSKMHLLFNFGQLIITETVQHPSFSYDAASYHQFLWLLLSWITLMGF